MEGIWGSTDEDERKRKMIMGAPLEGIQYQRQDNQQQAPVREQKGPDSVGTTAQKIMVNRGINQGLDYGIKKTGEGIEYGVNQAKDAYMQSQAPLAPQSQYDVQDIENGSGDTAMGEVNPSAYVEPSAPLAPSAPAAPAVAGTSAETMAAKTPGGDVISGMAGDAANDMATNVATDVLQLLMLLQKELLMRLQKVLLKL